MLSSNPNVLKLFDKVLCKYLLIWREKKSNDIHPCPPHASSQQSLLFRTIVLQEDLESQPENCLTITGGNVQENLLEGELKITDSKKSFKLLKMYILVIRSPNHLVRNLFTEHFKILYCQQHQQAV